MTRVRKRWSLALGAALLIAGGLFLWGGQIQETPPGDRPLEHLPETGQAPLRLVAFGTSLTAKASWPDMLATRLETCLQHPVQMIKVAGVGQGSPWALTQMDQVIAARPDLVLLEFSINDADLLDGVSLAGSRARHEALLDQLGAALPETRVMLMTMSPVSGLLQKAKRPRLGRYYGLYRDLAAVRGLPLADLQPRWQQLWDRNPALVPADGLHPHSQVASDLMVPVLTRLIGAGSSPVCAADPV